ncbi:putative integral membrane protein (TIGR02587 family) [Pseudorhizobium tarimense]|uniref:Integral membrane protein (TIGR02587 family) n=1 Tax=Pseudorhizobium tarimense TaxID=1079109 RepID=A0ABV2H4F3_9HYPH|nr:TIGR02587 family membrane protein [Pseudorhizobium tarimense]MCJ8518659.1 TIGR02587 family membrane protein [Pseudorhizobium tarimense]
MQTRDDQDKTKFYKPDSRRFLVGLARGAAGSLIFGLPMLMTMELWFLGFYIERYRLLLLLLVNIPLLVVLAHRIGFEETFTWRQAFRDAVIAYGIAIAMSAAVLTLLGVVKAGMPPTDILGKIAVQAVPASIGALLGRSQLGGQNDEEAAEEDKKKNRDMTTSYGRELFMMGIGALFLSLNVAPTEEIILISFKMTPWHALVTVSLSILIMHAFVYAVSFRGAHQLSQGTPQWHAIVRFTLPGYVVAILISLYVLWTFGRLDDTAFTHILMSAIVLGFPGAIGAAAARLIL